MARLSKSFSVLETLALESKEIGFNELNRKVGGIHRATLSSILRELILMGYVAKNSQTGKYQCGARLAIFLNIRKQGRAEFLLNGFMPVVKEMVKRFDVTVILFERVYNILLSIHKEMNPYAPAMQEVGTVNRKLWESPWGRCLIAFDEKQRSFFSQKQRIINEIIKRGYSFDDCEYFGHIRRLGFPIFDIDGRVAGCLGIGAISARFNTTRKNELVDFISVSMTRKNRKNNITFINGRRSE